MGFAWGRFGRIALLCLGVLRGVVGALPYMVKGFPYITLDGVFPESERRINY